MDETQSSRVFYHPICSEEEIDRILNVKNAKDHLLKIRADTIVDHMRLYRVYRNRALADEKNWSFEKSFDTTHYDSFLRNISQSQREKCLEVTFGNIFSNEPDGLIFTTEYGPIITISDSIQYFLKFCHLALLDFESEVPPHVRINALRIAIRVILKTESLDFLMDPRGIVPTNVGERMHDLIPYQLQFIAGHEFSHYILGHLSESNITVRPIFKSITENDYDYMPMEVYNQSQKDEFESDLKSITLPHYDESLKDLIIEASLLWFGCLELYECAVHELYPLNPWQLKSHPSARDRFMNIATNIRMPKDIDQRAIENMFESIDMYKDFLRKDISRDINLYDFYGSVYLDKPNSEWRGPELIDRKDYY